MRMDGVLRVILNVNLFKSMSCSLVQDKFIRFVASETPGKLTTFLLKVRESRLALIVKVTRCLTHNRLRTLLELLR